MRWWVQSSYRVVITLVKNTRATDFGIIDGQTCRQRLYVYGLEAVAILESGNAKRMKIRLGMWMMAAMVMMVMQEVRNMDWWIWWFVKRMWWPCCKSWNKGKLKLLLRERDLFLVPCYICVFFFGPFFSLLFFLYMDLCLEHGARRITWRIGRVLPLIHDVRT